MAGNGNGGLSSALRVGAVIATVLVLPVIGWIMVTVQANSEAIGELKAELPLRTSSRYTAEDAARDQARVGDRLADDERRIEQLEKDRRQP